MPKNLTESSWRELAIADFLQLDHAEVVMGSIEFGDRYFNGDVDLTWQEAVRAAIAAACPHDHQVEERFLTAAFARCVCQDCGITLPVGDTPTA